MNNSWLDRNRSIVFAVILLVALTGAAVIYLRQPDPDSIQIRPPEASPSLSPAVLPSPTLALVRVYVTGAVVKSDVYLLPRGSIVKDAIIAAGGFTGEADRERINQAMELKDQQQIHVPRLGEQTGPLPVQQPVPDSGGGRLNINTATSEQLESLPGIGPAMAQRIIDYRENNGGFKSIDQITEVAGIGDSTFAKIKDLITVE